MKQAARSLAERCPAVILYAELRNFTRLSEILPPERVLQLASDFFSLTTSAVKLHGGEVFSIHNDTVLAAFRSGPPAQFALHALQTSQDLLREFASLGERWQSEYGLPAALSFGIHFGETTFGMAGPLKGEQYIAFGDAVSIAERLVHRARTGEIVLSGDFIKALGEAGQQLGTQPLPSLELGRRPAIPICGILLDTRLDFT
jgi:adenylate cyclase